MLSWSPAVTWYRGPGEHHVVIDRDGIDQSVAREIASAFSTDKFPILLYGPQGRGKTCATYYFARHTIPKPGCQHILWHWSPRDLQAELIKDRGHAQQAFREAVVVVVDNFGATSADLSDFLSDEMIGLMDRRGNRKPTIFCSNLSPKQIADTMTPPLVSRLLGGTVVEYAGPDRRIQRVQKKGKTDG
jgi:DNA replication protein DnaC